MEKNLLVVGVAVIDMVMNVDEIPTKAEKYRANDAIVVGGGCAANAAVAIKYCLLISLKKALIFPIHGFYLTLLVWPASHPGGLRNSIGQRRLNDID